MGSWLFPRGNPNTNPPATRLRIQSSIQGLVRPIVWGQTRIAGNLIDYTDFASFQTQSGSGGGKGGNTGSGGKGGATNTNYSATVVVGLCEGPIVTVTGSWASKQFYSQNDVAHSGFSIFTGSTTQTAWSYMSAAHPANALNYRNLAYIAVANWQLGTSPELPQWNWEILSNVSYAYAATSTNRTPDLLNSFYNGNYPPVLQGTTPITPTTGLPDANPRDIIVDFLTNQHYGVQWPSNRIDTAMTQFSAQCLALGLVMSPALVEATEGQAFLQSIVEAAIASFRWSNGVLSVVPWFDQAITSGQVSQITQTGQVIPSPAFPPPMIQIALGTFVANVKVQASGGGAVYTQVAYSTFLTALGNQQYAVSPTGLYIFSPINSGSNVDITYTVAAQTSYQPYNTPIYDINLDLLPNRGSIGATSGDQPVQCVRKPTYYQYNSVKLEWLDRNNNYDPSVVEIKDQAAIDTFGIRARDQKTAHMFCIGAAATISGILQLGREKVANLYTFTVGPQYILLEVEDLVTITRAVMGLAQFPVRITEIQENEDGTLTITAEEYFGTVTAPLFSSQLPSGIVNNYNANPGSVNPPVIFEAPAALGIAATGSPYVVAAAVSGVNVSVWGGCEVWASGDGNTYAHYGTINGPSRMGVLTATLSSASTISQVGQSFDLTSTLAVDLTESNGALLSGSAIDLGQNNTLCWVAYSTSNSALGEVIGYETATLTSTSSTSNKYSLTTLTRGNFQNSTDMGSHASGAAFVRIDPGIFYTSFNPQLVGQTVYFKFQSFNHWGGGLQNLAQVGAVAYTFTGNALNTPLPQVQNLRAFFEAGYEKLYWDEVADTRPGILYEIRKGSAYASAITIGLVAHPPFVIFGGNDTYWVSARVQTTQGLLVYSVAPSDVVIAGNTLVPFIFKTVNEANFQSASWPGTISASTTVVWNPSSNSTAILFSNNYLTVANPSTFSTQSTYAFSDGTQEVYYLELVANALGTSSSNNPIGIGLASSNFISGPSSNWLGDDSSQRSVSLFCNGQVYYGGAVVTTIQGFSTGDNIGIAYDGGANKIWFRVNGGNWNNNAANSPSTNSGGISIAGLSTVGAPQGPFPSPAVNLRLSTGAKVTAKFSSASWTYSPPANSTGTGFPFAALTAPSISRVGASPNAVLVGAVGSSYGTYETNFLSIMNIGYVPAHGVFMNVSFLGTGSPIGSNILSLADFLSQPNILGSSAAQFVDVHPEIAYASTLSSLAVPAYSSWQKFVPGIYNGQYFKTRMVLASMSPYTIQPYCLGMTWTAQVQLRTDHYTLVSSTTATVTQNFRLDADTSSNAVPFNTDPVGSTLFPQYTYSIIAAEAGDFLTGGISLSQFSFQIFNASSVAVSREVNFTMEGI